MSIQQRRGAEKDFDATKMLPGELAVTTDGTRKVYVAFAPGDVKELASTEEVEEVIQGGIEEIEEKKKEALAEFPNYEKQLAELEMYKANSIISESTGTTVTTTDSAKVKPKNIRLYGKTEQPSTEGNQLCNTYNIPSREIDGLTITQDNGRLILNGTTTNYIDIHCASDKYNQEVKKIANTVWGSYTLSNNLGFENWIGATGSWLNDTVATSENIKLESMFVRIPANKTYNNAILEIMINAGTTVKPFEQYTGGEASPNKNYQQPLNSHGDGGSIVGSIHANLLTPSMYSVNPNSTSMYSGIVKCTYKFLAGKTYKLSFDTSNTGYECYVHHKFAWYQFTSNGQRVSVTQTFEEDVVFNNDDFICLYQDITKGAGEITNIVLEYVDTEQLFTVLAPNGLKGIPLGTTIPDAIKNSPIHMSGVYHDGEQYWIGDTKNENGKDVQRIWKGNPNKQLVFTSRDSNGRCFVFGNGIFDVMFMNADIPSMSSVAIWSAWGNRDDGTFVLHQNGLYYKDNTKTLDEINIEFSKLGTDIEFAGVLAEPIITDLTQEEIDQYNALLMNYPNTTVVNDAGAYMEVEYVCDTQKHIEQNYVSKEAHNEHEKRIVELEKAIVNS